MTNLRRFSRAPGGALGCGVRRVDASPAARQRGGCLCGHGEQAAMEELQNQRSEAGQWNKTSHREAVKPGKAHFFHLGFLCSGTGGGGDGGGPAPVSAASPDRPYRNVCVCVWSRPIADTWRVSGREDEGLPRAQPGLF